jgi:hypothetical protein
MPLRRPPQRITSIVQEKSLRDVANALFNPFGLDPVFSDMHDLEPFVRTLSITVRNATLWEAIDAFCQRSQLRLSTSPTLSFEEIEKAVSVRYADVDDLRVEAWAEAFVTAPWYYLSLSAILPPLQFPIRTEVMSLTVEGKEIKPITPLPVDRKTNAFTKIKFWETTLVSDETEIPKSLHLTGCIRLAYPVQLDETSFPLDGTPPQERRLAGWIYTLKKSEPTSTGRRIALKIAQAVPKKRPEIEDSWYLVWLEDANGHWMEDITGWCLYPDEIQFEGEWRQKGESAAARLRVIHCGRVERVDVPFEFPDLRLPDSPYLRKR